MFAPCSSGGKSSNKLPWNISQPLASAFVSFFGLRCLITVEVLTECRQLLLLHVYVDMEVGLVELAQAVLLACHAVGRFQDGEAVLRDEGLLVPRLSLLVVVGRVVPKGHEDHQDDGGDKGKEDAVEVFPHTVCAYDCNGS